MITFNFGGVSFVLDARLGKLQGGDNTAERHALVAIIGEPSKFKDDEIFEIYGGVPWKPFRTTEITNPYKHIDQFSLMLMMSEEEHDWDFPSELEQYLPYWDDEPKIDKSTLSPKQRQISQEIQESLCY